MSREQMIGLVFFICGICVGSFLDLCIDRIPKKESIANPPSHCGACGKRIKEYDLIPILSYIILRGKCRFCGEKLSILHPLGEAITGIIFVLIYREYGVCYLTFKYIVLVSLFIVIGMIDLRTTDIYDSTIWVGVLTGIVFMLYRGYIGGEIVTSIYGGMLGFGIIAVIILLTGGMGWGDAEMMLIAGLYLGTAKTVLVLLSAFVIGGFIGSILLISKKKSRKDYVPFGQFISLATLLAVLYGDRLIGLYMVC